MAQVDRGIIVPVGRVIPRGTRGDTVFRPNYAIIHNVEILTTDFEVIGTVVELVPIFMVNKLAGEEFSVEDLFHNIAVFRNRPPVDLHLSVTLRHFSFSRFSLRTHISVVPRTNVSPTAFCNNASRICS